MNFHGLVYKDAEEIESRNLRQLVRKIKSYKVFLEKNDKYNTTFIDVGDGIAIKGYGIILLTWALLCIQALIEIYTSLWWIELILMALMIIINLNTIKDLWSFGISLFKKGQNAK